MLAEGAVEVVVEVVVVEVVVVEAVVVEVGAVEAVIAFFRFQSFTPRTGHGPDGADHTIVDTPT